MRVASLVFGLTAGLVGIAIMLLLLVVGGIALALRADGWGEIVAHLMVTVVIAGIGMVGAALAPNRPGASAVLQSLAAVSGLLTAGLFWLLSAGLFGLGAFTGALAWWRASSRRRLRAVAGDRMSEICDDSARGAGRDSVIHAAAQADVSPPSALRDTPEAQGGSIGR